MKIGDAVEYEKSIAGNQDSRISFIVEPFLILLLAISFSYMEGRQIAKDKGQLALELSKTISFMPTVKEAFETDDPASIIQPVVEKIRRETGVEFIVVGNDKEIRYSHPLASEIGKRMKGGDNSRAIREGKYYVSEAAGSLGLSIRGNRRSSIRMGRSLG